MGYKMDREEIKIGGRELGRERWRKEGEKQNLQQATGQRGSDERLRTGNGPENGKIVTGHRAEKEELRNRDRELDRER